MWDENTRMVVSSTAHLQLQRESLAREDDRWNRGTHNRQLILRTLEQILHMVHSFIP